jgi:hypothetical protein
LALIIAVPVALFGTGILSELGVRRRVPYIRRGAREKAT